MAKQVQLLGHKDEEQEVRNAIPAWAQKPPRSCEPQKCSCLGLQHSPPRPGSVVGTVVAQPIRGIYPKITALPCFCTQPSELEVKQHLWDMFSLCFSLAPLAAPSVPVASPQPLTSCSALVSTLGTTTLLSFHLCILTLPLSSYLPSHSRDDLTPLMT